MAEHANVMNQLQPIIDEFLKPIEEITNLSASTNDVLANAFKDYQNAINYAANDLTQKALKIGHQLAKSFPDSNPGPSSGPSSGPDPKPNEPTPQEPNGQTTEEPDLTSKDSAIPPADKNVAAREIASRMMQANPDALKLNSAEIEKMLNGELSDLMGIGRGLESKEVAPLVHRFLSELQPATTEASFVKGKGAIEYPEQLDPNWLTPSGKKFKSSGKPSSEMAKHVISHFVNKHNLNPLDWESINGLLKKMEKPWTSVTASSLFKTSFGGDAKVRQITRTDIAKKLFEWYGFRVQKKDFIGKKKLGKESGSNWDLSLIHI